MAGMAALARGGKGGEKEILVQGRPFQTLVDMVLLGSRRYSCADLLSVLSSCGVVGCDDDHLIDKARPQCATELVFLTRSHFAAQ